jgi:hypothetical protein
MDDITAAYARELRTAISGIETNTPNEPIASEGDSASGSPRHPTAGQNAEANAALGWESFFHEGPGVSDDALAERASQEQADREPF